MRRWISWTAAAAIFAGLLVVSPSSLQAKDGPFQLLGTAPFVQGTSTDVTPVRWGYGYRPYYRSYYGGYGGYGYRPYYGGYYRPYYGGYYRPYYGGYYGGYRPGFGVGIGIY